MAPTPTGRIVVIGGGTGSFTVLSALKTRTRNLTAIVNMADDGGSTGVLRDELGALPPGDIRQCLVALSEAPEIMRNLFNYRFSGATFGGHSFGNLFLSALEQTTGSFPEAIETASRVLNIVGRVVPVTLVNTRLVLEREDGTVIHGQHAIELNSFDSATPKLHLEPKAELNPEARASIALADLIVIAPGNLYASIAPALLSGGMKTALRESPAKIAYIANLVTKPGQTDDYQVHDFGREIERYIGKGALDYVIYNTRKPGADLLDKYAHDGEYWVNYDEAKLATQSYRSIGRDLIAENIAPVHPNDTLIPRTLIRHDGELLADILMELLGV